MEGRLALTLGGYASVRKTTTGTVVVSSVQTYNGGTNILGGVLQANVARALPAGGQVTVNNATLAVGATQYLASLTMTNSAQASVSLATAGTAGSTIKTNALSIDGTSLLDLRDNNLIVDYTGGGTGTLAAVQSLIKAGAGNKSDGSHYDWDGTTGITSSSITLTGTGKQYLSLGIRDFGYALYNATVQSSIEGVPVESSTTGGTASIVVKYTWMGDMDLDGKVTVNDYLEFLHYLTSPPPAADITWMTGDFNYDGKINVNDYLLLIGGYTASTGSPPSADDEQITFVPIPEPATLSLLALGTAAVLRRRSRHKA